MRGSYDPGPGFSNYVLFGYLNRVFVLGDQFAARVFWIVERLYLPNLLISFPASP